MKYLRWRRENGAWIGRTATGKDAVSIKRYKRGGKCLARLDRLVRSSGCEIISNVRHAKEYANELARLWNYPAFD